LEDLEYADDLALLSQPCARENPMLEEVAASVGLRINKHKTKIMNVKTVMLTNGPTDKVEKWWEAAVEKCSKYYWWH